LRKITIATKSGGNVIRDTTKGIDNTNKPKPTTPTYSRPSTPTYSRPSTPIKTTRPTTSSISRPIQSTAPKPKPNYGQIGNPANIGGNLRFIKDRAAERNKILNQLKQSYELEGNQIDEKKKDACYKKVKSRYKIWPSAYASGALVKCRKVGASNWGNKTEGYNYSNWRDDFKAMDYEFIDIMKPTPLKSSLIEENYTRIQERGKTYYVMLSWRGRYISIQLFFPKIGKPSKMEVSYEIQKIYPGAIVLSYKPHFRDPTKPLIQVGIENESR